MLDCICLLVLIDGLSNDTLIVRLLNAVVDDIDQDEVEKREASDEGAYASGHSLHGALLIVCESDRVGIPVYRLDVASETAYKRIIVRHFDLFY